MKASLIVNGDICVFNPVFPGCNIVTPGVPIIGSSAVKVGQQTVCVVGDALAVLASGVVTYLTGHLATAIVSISAINPGSISLVTNSAGLPMLKAGGGFISSAVVSIAVHPGGVIAPLPIATLIGTGDFVATNTLVTAG